MAGNQLRQRGAIYDRKAARCAVRAERARPVGDAWLLEGVRIYDSNRNIISRRAQMIGLKGIDAEQLTLAKVDPEELDYFTLSERIGQLERAGRTTDAARAGLLHKLSGPLSTLLMPLLAAVAAFGLARSGQVLLRATVGMALGFAYFVADNFSLAMGNVGPPPVPAPGRRSRYSCRSAKQS